jgi:hypothetical protein
MLSPATAEKVRLVMLVLRWNQLRGNIPAKPVSAEAMAEVSAALGIPVSERTFRRVEQVALAKARLHAECLQSQIENSQA